MIKYKVVCAWCGKLIKIKYTKDKKMKDKISHSICKHCFKEVINENRRKSFN